MIRILTAILFLALAVLQLFLAFETIRRQYGFEAVVVNLIGSIIWTHNAFTLL